MNTYQSFAKTLLTLLGADTAVRIRVDGYMPLSIEAIGTSPDGNRLISLSGGLVAGRPDVGVAGVWGREEIGRAHV